MSLEIREADLNAVDDSEAVVALLDEYAREPIGQSMPLTQHVRARVIEGLSRHPGAFVLLACDGVDRIGVAVCFWGFSTFAGLPLINIHDLVVTAHHRGKGVGRALMEEVLRCARDAGCAKVTLEVSDDNEPAKRLYKRLGFGPWSSPMLFVSRSL